MTRSLHGSGRLGLLVAGGVLASGLAGAPAFAGDAGSRDIIDTAAAAGSFKTLAAALEAADLTGALRGPGPFTVFAPTDAAFGKLPEGTLNDLLKPENSARLKSILLYHVVPGRTLSADIHGNVSPKTLEGSALPIMSGAGGVDVDGAKVVQADIAASNGVIHVVDAVLLPGK